MDVGLIDSLLREAEAEAEAEAELWNLQTRHIAAHASGPPASRKRAREGPGGLLHLTRQTGPVLIKALLAQDGGEPDIEDAAQKPY